VFYFLFILLLLAFYLHRNCIALLLALFSHSLCIAFSSFAPLLCFFFLPFFFILYRCSPRESLLLVYFPFRCHVIIGEVVPFSAFVRIICRVKGLWYPAAAALAAAWCITPPLPSSLF
jgi:hypothetical protein